MRIFSKSRVEVELVFVKPPSGWSRSRRARSTAMSRRTEDGWRSSRSVTTVFCLRVLAQRAKGTEASRAPRRSTRDAKSSPVVDDPQRPPDPPLPDVVAITREVLSITHRPVVPLPHLQTLHDAAAARGRRRVARRPSDARAPKKMQFPLGNVHALVVRTYQARLLGVPVPLGRASGGRLGATRRRRVRAVVEHGRRRVRGRVPPRFWRLAV